MSFDFASITTPFRMQPGLRRLAPGERQLTPAHPGDRVLREKLAVLGAFARQALLSTPGFDPAPALLALDRHAMQEHPQAWYSEGHATAHALKLGWSLVQGEVRQTQPDAWPEIGACLRALPGEWRHAGLLCLAFAEDFAVIDGVSATIPWMAVCLPSQWAPEDKVGRHFGEVHAPVADNQRLVCAGPQLARLVTGESRWERFVWTITRHPRLHGHPDRVDPASWPRGDDAEALAAQAHFRTERQTFIPLPEHAQAVFTIHIELQPLRDALKTPEQRHAVHQALASMSPEVLAYRGLSDARDRLLVWLAGAAPP